MNNAYIYGILTGKKKFINLTLLLPLPIQFASLCSPWRLQHMLAKQIWTPFFTVHLLSLWSTVMEFSDMLIGDSPHNFRGKKIRDGNGGYEVSSTCFTPWQCVIKLTPAKIHWNFSIFFVLSRKFLQTFSKSFQAVLSVKFNLILKSCSSNCCVICGIKKLFSSILASNILGNIFPK